MIQRTEREQLKREKTIQSNRFPKEETISNTFNESKRSIEVRKMLRAIAAIAIGLERLTPQESLTIRAKKEILTK